MDRNILPPKSDSILPTTTGKMSTMSDTERAKYTVGKKYYMVVHTYTTHVVILHIQILRLVYVARHVRPAYFSH